jgi:hypothetical protein
LAIVAMLRSVGTALVGTAVLAALAGCAHQDSFGLPDLTPGGTSPGAQVYPSYGLGYGYGNVYGYANPYYAAQGPYPYGYGYAYNPYPRYIFVPCADSNRDGHCDTQPPKQHHDHDRDQHGHDDAGDDRPAQPHHGEVPRVRDGSSREVAPNAQQRAVPAPAPVPQQPAQVRPEPRRATPPEAANQRGPRVGSRRPSTTGEDVVSSRPTQEP